MFVMSKPVRLSLQGCNSAMSVSFDMTEDLSEPSSHIKIYCTVCPISPGRCLASREHCNLTRWTGLLYQKQRGAGQMCHEGPYQGVLVLRALKYGYQQ